MDVVTGQGIHQQTVILALNNGFCKIVLNSETEHKILGTMILMQFKTGKSLTDHPMFLRYCD